MFLCIWNEQMYVCILLNVTHVKLWFHCGVELLCTETSFTGKIHSNVKPYFMVKRAYWYLHPN